MSLSLTLQLRECFEIQFGLIKNQRCLWMCQKVLSISSKGYSHWSINTRSGNTTQRLKREEGQSSLPPGFSLKVVQSTLPFVDSTNLALKLCFFRTVSAITWKDFLPLSLFPKQYRRVILQSISVVLAIISNLEMIWSIWEDMHGLCKYCTILY